MESMGAGIWGACTARTCSQLVRRWGAAAAAVLSEEGLLDAERQQGLRPAAGCTCARGWRRSLVVG